jgi:hypothetical protein
VGWIFGWGLGAQQGREDEEQEGERGAGAHGLGMSLYPRGRDQGSGIRDQGSV